MSSTRFSSLTSRRAWPDRKEILMNSRRNTRPGCIVLLAMLGLTIGSIAAAAQNSSQNVVPPTAVQAAKMPQFAARLAHRTGLQASTKATRSDPRPGACSQKLPGDRSRPFRNLKPDQFEWSYDNGPAIGNIDGWTINFGFVVSDSFNVSYTNTTVTGMSFAAWLFSGDTLTSVEVSITSGENGGTSYFDQIVNFTQGTCTFNQFGYTVCTEWTNLNGPTLDAGTYWVNLQNASVPSGDPVYWDENSGVGCGGAGCPSSASESEVGTIPSEAFTILGTASSTTTTTTSSRNNYCIPEQYGSFSVIHDFNGTDGSSPSGVAIDRAGNLYGQAQSSSGNGTIYKLAQAADWALSTLYNFIGGASGSDPQGVIVGANDNLYGAATGGIQNCSNDGYCGFIFGLRPSPTACLTGSCSWTENAVYSFTGPTDAQQGYGLVSDRAGNLYGVSPSGGTQQQGAVFELTPSIGGWTESILYSFQGGASGGYPVDVIVGNDGNLYGMTAGGGTGGGGVVFQLTPSGGSWTESVLYDIPNNSYSGSNPHSLIQDSAGNLYGIYEYSPCCANTDGLIFMLTPSNGQWTFTELHHGNQDLDGDDVFPNMTLDAGGNLWGTGIAYDGCMNTVDYAYIFELGQVNNTWQYWTPVFWSYTYWKPSGALAMDTQGNLYGTTNWCGAYGQGGVWKLSP
jgi:uncharacterized repeat protein (TIGR03803 family)